ncbi:MAG TPA: diguanylate cyclase, partial [Micromonosporaceae bacterium]
MAPNASWITIALLVGCAAVAVVGYLWRTRTRHRHTWIDLLCAGVAASAVGWITSMALVVAAPTGSVPASPAGIIVATAAAVATVGVLLAAVVLLPSEADSGAARLRRAVDGLQVTCALWLAGWIITGLWFTPGRHIVVHASLPTVATGVALVAAAATVGFAVVTVLQTPPRRCAVACLTAGAVAVGVGGAGTVIAAADFQSRGTVIVSGVVTILGMFAIGYAASFGRQRMMPIAEVSPMRWGLPFATVGGALAMLVVQLAVGGAPDEIGAIAAVVTGFVLVFRQALALADVRRYFERLREEEAYLRTLAYTDPLTGVGNRRHLMATLDAVMTDGRAGALVTLDLDDFTGVNDARGHDAGDAVLTEVGARLRTLLAPGDVAARTGGDEFAVYLSSDESDVDTTVQRLVALLAEPYETCAGRIVITISVGLVPCHVAADVPTLLRNADVALRFAKRDATGAVRRYDATYDDFAQRRVHIERALRVAERAGEFTLAYQPIVTLPSGRPVAVEALLRWNSAELGRVAPDEFIPIAEDAGLIASIDRWVMDEACGQLARWLADGHDLWLSVNVSVRELHLPEYVSQVVDLLHAHKVPPGR